MWRTGDEGWKWKAPSHSEGVYTQVNILRKSTQKWRRINTFWYFKNHKFTSASGHNRPLMMDLLSWQNSYETEQNIQSTLLYEGYWNSQKILNSWCFRHGAGSTGFWSLSKETHILSPAVALAFCWSLFWSWHRMVELKLNANLNKLSGQIFEPRLLK